MALIRIGTNFGAGMTGGMAYLYDPEGVARHYVNAETLLLVLDQNMFNTTWRESSPTDPQSYGELTLDFADWVDTLLRTGFDYGNGKFALRDVLRARDGVYGMAATASGTGFAADGSYRYTPPPERPACSKRPAMRAP